MTTINTAVDLMISFDTTSSMHTVLESARRDLGSILRCLFKASANLRVGLIVHGDYGDVYETRLAQPTDDANRLIKFLADAPNTCGLDYPECYELVLHQAATKVHWRKKPGVARLLVLLGDAVPHAPNSRRNKYRLDWRKEARSLADLNVSVYCVDCGGVGTGFYSFANELCGICNGAAVPYRGSRELRLLLKELLLLVKEQPKGRTAGQVSLERRYQSYHSDSQMAETVPTSTTAYSSVASTDDSSTSSITTLPNSRSTPSVVKKCESITPSCVVLALARGGGLAIGKTAHWAGRAMLYLALIYLLYCLYVDACW